MINPLTKIRRRLSLVDWKRASLNLKEVFRCAVEYRQLRDTWPVISQQTPQGNGRPVLILPAFGLNDSTTTALRNRLTEKGYKPYTWNGGFNFGFKDETAYHLYERIKQIYEENGHQKISLIGHSLGGIYARGLAQEFPEMVENVITLGTPFGIGMEKGEARRHTITKKLISEKYSLDTPGVAERILTPPPVPTTSIFSKSDGIGGWQACLNPDTPLSENIQVSSSHAGMVWNKETLEIVLDRLAAPVQGWKKHPKASKEACPPNPNWKPNPGSDWRFFVPRPTPQQPPTSRNNSGPRPPAAPSS